MFQLLFKPGTYIVQVIVVIPAYLMKSSTTEESHPPTGRPLKVIANCILEKVL
jgi:hypothetical protein